MPDVLLKASVAEVELHVFMSLYKETVQLYYRKPKL